MIIYMEDSCKNPRKIIEKLQVHLALGSKHRQVFCKLATKSLVENMKTIGRSRNISLCFLKTDDSGIKCQLQEADRTISAMYRRFFIVASLLFGCHIAEAAKRRLPLEEPKYSCKGYEDAGIWWNTSKRHAVGMDHHNVTTQQIINLHMYIYKANDTLLKGIFQCITTLCSKKR